MFGLTRQGETPTENSTTNFGETSDWVKATEKAVAEEVKEDPPAEPRSKNAEAAPREGEESDGEHIGL